MAARLDLLGRMLSRHRHTITLDGGVERRARFAHDRMQREFAKLNDGEPPMTFEECLANLVESGIEADEATYGLAGAITGEVVSKDVMEEGKRRRRLVMDAVERCKCDPYDDVGPYGHEPDCPAYGVTQDEYNWARARLRVRRRHEEGQDGGD